ncbi:MAG: helix-turn-helix transcriptional regulator [Acutalibacteraceae bacterium]|nr:helix-turn-helix transcriptional regulator [Acutalibacteraceae bacterium]
MLTRLRDLREDKDLTQKQLAALLKIHQTTYSDYELGNLNVPADVLIKLASFYKTSVDYLLFVTDNPNPYIK